MWKFIAAIIGAAWLALDGGIHAQTAYGLFYRQDYNQVGDFVFTNAPTIPTWEAWIRGSTVPKAQIVAPSGKTYSLKTDSEGAYVLQPAMNFPFGSYHFLVIASGVTNQTEVTQPPPGYPGPIGFVGLANLPLRPGQDLTLTWRAAAGVLASDYLHLSVLAFNLALADSWEYHTPWPGQTGALRGTATSAIVPGSLLQPGDMLTLKITHYRPAYTDDSGGITKLGGSAISASTTVTIPDVPVNNDVALYRLLRGRIFTQSSEVIVNLNPEKGYAWEALARATDQERLISAEVKLPNTQSVILTNDTDLITWETNLVANTEAQLTTLAPNGLYIWSFNGTANGQQTAALNLDTTSFPAPSLVHRLSALQTNSFTNDIVVQWTSPAGAASTDQIEFIVRTSEGWIVFQAPDYSAGAAPLPGTTTAVTIPADALYDGEDYIAAIRYIQIGHTNSTTLQNVPAISGSFSETRFSLGSLTAAPLEIETTNLLAGVVGEDYLDHLRGYGGRGTLTWNIASGTLPRGLSMDSAGLVQGTPYEGGTFHLTVQITDQLGNKLSQTVSVLIAGVLTPPAIDTAILPEIEDGLYHYIPLNLSGGAAPFHWSLQSGRLPDGMVLQERSGRIAGIAEEAGLFPIDIQVEDGAGQVTHRSLVLNVPSATNNPALRIDQLRTTPPASLQATALNQNFELKVRAQPGEFATVQVSTDLVLWQELLRTNVPISGLLQWAGTPGARAFYRILRGIPEPKYTPLTIQVASHPTLIARDVLTPAGLTLVLTNTDGVVWKLEVPPGALNTPTPISMALISSARGFPFETRFMGGVTFSPEGLSFIQPATLTATFPGALPPDTTGFAFQSGGADFHLYPCAIGANKITFSVNHFSGLLGGGVSGDNAGSMTLNTACNSQSSLETSVATQIRSGASRESLWAMLKAWYDQTVGPHLKSAAQNDELLWFVRSEFLAWKGLTDQALGPEYYDQPVREALQYKEKGWKALTMAYKNAVNRAEQKCVSDYRPFQAIRMMKIAASAREIGLETWAGNFFSPDLMLERFKRCFRFEFQLESKIDVTSKKGHFIGDVISKKCAIEARDYTEGSDEQELTHCTPGSLFSNKWYLKTKKDRTRPIEKEGKLIPIRLKLNANYEYPDNPERCSKGVTYDDPTDPDISLSFDASDPVQQYKVKKAKGGWQEVEANGMNWFSQFKLAHAMQLVNENDESGKAHPSVPKIPDADWEYKAGELFAEAPFEGTPEYAAGGSGTFTENSKLRLYHAPK